MVMAILGAALFGWLILDQPVRRARRRHHRPTEREVNELKRELGEFL